MIMEKEFIKNRKGQEIAVVIDKPNKQQGLVFVIHGLGGFKEQYQMEAMAKAFRDNNYTVIRFDTTNSIGESGGKLEDATMTNYYQDLEDVVEWAKSKDWYQEPFCLTGHSVGGFCVIWFAMNHPQKVKAIAPISPVVSGELFSQTKEISEELESWKNTGIREWESTSKPGLIKRLKYDFIEDSYQYDLLKAVEQIRVPILLVIGELDETTPLKHQRLLYQALPSNQKKELHIINGARHTFAEEGALEQLESIISEWVRKIK